MIKIILLGAPGAGKGTQALALRRQFNAIHISTGDLIRKEIAEKTDIGKKLQDIVSQGQLVADDIMIALIESQIIAGNDQGFVLDGFPRTLEQAEYLDKMFNKLAITDYQVIQLAMSDEEIIARIVNRFQCDGCGAMYNSKLKPTKVADVCDVCGGSKFNSRSDDNVDSLSIRLKEYNKVLDNIVPYYIQKDVLSVVNGAGDIQDIEDNIKNILNITEKH